MDDKNFFKRSAINWNHVYYFSQVADAGSIKEAAPRLGLSPSTLSEHICQLERDLDILLFHRHHRKLILTPQGSRLFFYAKQMFETGQRLIDVVSPIPLGCYPVSIGLVPNPSLQIAHQLIRRYIEAYGPLNMKMFHSHHDELEKGLSSARFDFGFSDRAPERKNIHHQVISSSKLSFYVAAHLGGENFKDLLGRLPLLVCSPDLSSRSTIEKSFEEAGLAPCATMTSDFPSVLLDLCAAGQGIAVFSEEVVLGSNIPLAHLQIPLDTPNLVQRLYVLWSKDGENAESVGRLRNLFAKEPPESAAPSIH